MQRENQSFKYMACFCYLAVLDKHFTFDLKYAFYFKKFLSFFLDVVMLFWESFLTHSPNNVDKIGRQGVPNSMQLFFCAKLLLDT